ncbi:MAG: PrsW family intramembrane metalloprotease [Bacteroidales bacterium]|nr:PrsW family intramembrane metalloprotease [Bacteroidales bacterium]
MDPLLLISILPVVILLGYIYLKDKNEREPLGLLLKAFFCGTLVAVLILLWGVFEGIAGFSLTAFAENSAVLKSFFQAAIPEEGLKFLFLYWLIWNNKEFNEHFDGIVYAVFVSMGFACVENILYVYSGGFGTGVARALLAVPGHFLFAVIMGYFFSRARFTPLKRKYLLAMAFICPVLAHGLYDTLCFAMEMYGESTGLSSVLNVVFIAFDIKLWQIGLKAIRTHCHVCGAKIPKGEINCPYCDQMVKYS